MIMKDTCIVFSQLVYYGEATGSITYVQVSTFTSAMNLLGQITCPNLLHRNVKGTHKKEHNALCTAHTLACLYKNCIYIFKITVYS